MLQNQRNEIALLAQAPLALPEIPEREIAQLADQENAPAAVEQLARSQFNAVNTLTSVTGATASVHIWQSTLAAEYLRLERLRSGTRPFSVDHTNERSFRGAGVYRVIMLVIAGLFLGGLAILLNTISASISSSGEIADLTNAPLRAAAWGFLPIAGMLTGHMAFHLAKRDTVKSMVSWGLIGITAVSVVGWIVAFGLAFPLGASAEAAGGNIFEAAPQPAFSALMWLMMFQLFGEVAFGGLVGIVLEHLATRGRKEVVTRSAQHEEIDQSQRDIVQDQSEADRLLGILDDYQRRFENAAGVYVGSCNALLVDMQNQLRTDRGAALINLIARYTPTNPRQPITTRQEVEHA